MAAQKRRKFDGPFKWIAGTLATVVIGISIGFGSWTASSIQANRHDIDKAGEKYSLKTECQQRANDQEKKIDEVKAAVEDLRKEQRELIKAVYKSIRHNGNGK